MGRCLAFLYKDLKIAVSYKMQFVFQFLQVFFSLAVIYFVGKIVPAEMMSRYGGDYFSFALVGVAVNSYMRAGLVMLTNDIRRMMNQGVFEALCAGPMGYMSLMVSISLWQFLFETIRLAMYFVFGVLIFGFDLGGIDILACGVVMVETVVVFLLLGIISSSVLVLIKRGDPLNWIFSSVAGLLAGTMFPVDVLPSYLRSVSQFVPLTHSLEAMRKIILCGASFGDVEYSGGAMEDCFAVISNDGYKYYETSDGFKAVYDLKKDGLEQRPIEDANFVDAVKDWLGSR